jgi:hypothetical protein
MAGAGHEDGIAGGVSIKPAGVVEEVANCDRVHSGIADGVGRRSQIASKGMILSSSLRRPFRQASEWPPR